MVPIYPTITTAIITKAIQFRFFGFRLQYILYLQSHLALFAPWLWVHGHQRIMQQQQQQQHYHHSIGYSEIRFSVHQRIHYALDRFWLGCRTQWLSFFIISGAALPLSYTAFFLEGGEGDFWWTQSPSIKASRLLAARNYYVTPKDSVRARHKFRGLPKKAYYSVKFQFANILGETMRP